MLTSDYVVLLTIFWNTNYKPKQIIKQITKFKQQPDRPASYNSNREMN